MKLVLVSVMMFAGLTVLSGITYAQPIKLGEVLVLHVPDLKPDTDTKAFERHVLTQVLPKIRDIRRLGSAAIDLCLLADGSIDLYYERGLNPWDMAAGAIVATEAGAVVTGLRGGPAGNAMTVAGPPDLVAQLTAILEAADADGAGSPERG